MATELLVAIVNSITIALIGAFLTYFVYWLGYKKHKQLKRRRWRKRKGQFISANLEAFLEVSMLLIPWIVSFLLCTYVINPYIIQPMLSDPESFFNGILILILNLIGINQ